MRDVKVDYIYGELHDGSIKLFLNYQQLQTITRGHDNTIIAVSVLNYVLLITVK